MKVQESRLTISNSTLKQLLWELSEECENITNLINQLQSTNLDNDKKGEILAELLAASIHLEVHCDEEFQALITEEMDNL
ncbi:conserved hypothetical protein [Rippkaea orientalis PCC 8801]|uniref:Uncharacterized protein n=1 Tax=Rippkaea orientalis (strain PCC 8801 / RF-1) TaxID=41431 RepID=B7JXE0_RIPO1|nr:hypothetical protein [Rippkaea orientalis]ACK67128.1 conserved hypothetical protein [Rippkaea orientalis PCC 8801]